MMTRRPNHLMRYSVDVFQQNMCEPVFTSACLSRPHQNPITAFSQAIEVPILDHLTTSYAQLRR